MVFSLPVEAAGCPYSSMFAVVASVDVGLAVGFLHIVRGGRLMAGVCRCPGLKQPEDRIGLGSIFTSCGIMVATFSIIPLLRVAGESYLRPDASREVVGKKKIPSSAPPNISAASCRRTAFSRREVGC